MRALAEAKGGWLTGPVWGDLVLPERHQEVMAREIRGQCKKPRLNENVGDAPATVQTSDIRRLIRERRRGQGPGVLRVLVLFAGAGGVSEG